MFVPLLLSIGVLACLALTAGGLFIVLRRPANERKRGLLMLAVGLVTMMNIWLWSTMPKLSAVPRANIVAP